MARHRLAPRPSRSRVRALLAGGLVLGVGSTATLASWTDSEYGSGTFTASSFSIESSVDGALYSAHPTSPGAAIAFAGDGMSPNTQRYGSVLVRTTTGSSAGTLTLSGATISPSGSNEATVLGAALRYRVVQTTGTCSAAAFSGSPTWIVGGPSTSATLTTGMNAVTVPLAAASALAAGSSTGLCFEVSLPAGAANTLQGTSTTAVWQLTATSN